MSTGLINVFAFEKKQILVVAVIRSHTKTLFFYTSFDPIPEENRGKLVVYI